jgi:hypothetical protein
LLEALRKVLPFLAREDARDDVERNQPLGSGFLSIDGERDAKTMEERVRLSALERESVLRRIREPRRERAIVLSHFALLGMHFVENRLAHSHLASRPAM